MSIGQQTDEFEKAVLNSNPSEDWVYLSEGNKHIVFRYVKTDGILNCLILKINKDFGESEDIFASNYIVQKWLGQKYANTIIHPLHLSQSFVLHLVNQLQHQRRRPLKRAKKHPFHNKNCKHDNSVYYASLERNACSLDATFTNDSKQQQQPDIFTFDMKPKWMFLNLSPFVDSNNIKKHICRFSMHQHLKLNVTKTIETLSKYCPLSLLSDNVSVVARNIKHLVLANQTNFKIFYQNNEIKSYKFMKQHHIKSIASIIVKHQQLFQKISMLQRLDKFDITVIYQMFIELKSRNKLDILEKQMNDTNILDEIIKQLNEDYDKTQFGKEKCFCRSGIDMERIERNDCDKKNNNLEMNQFIKYLTDKQLSFYITEYLLSAIFKDCQVLITVNFNNVDNHKITVVDLHSKPTERIEKKWLKQDRNIVDNYFNIFTK